MMNSSPPGLKITMLIGAIGGFIFGILSMATPNVVIGLCGLDPAAAPAIQQSGAAAIGFSVAALMVSRASQWEQVRIAVLSIITFNLLSALGAFYYVVLQGVATAGLIAILIFSAFLTLAPGYFYLTQGGTKR